MVLLKTCFLEPQGDERDEDVFKAVLRTWLHGKRLFFFKDAVFLSVTDFRAWESLDVFFRALESSHGKNEKFFKQNGPNSAARRTWAKNLEPCPRGWSSPPRPSRPLPQQAPRRPTRQLTKKRTAEKSPTKHSQLTFISNT